MAIALLVLTALFALLLLGRLGGTHRALLLPRWPALVFAGAAVFAFARGALWLGTAMAVAATAAWMLYPEWTRSRRAGPGADDAGDAEARALLGLGRDAGEAEIRRAYRAKMTRAHPDRGGSHAAAAKLTAARDRLLRKRAQR